jgi:hypothetical protein
VRELLEERIDGDVVTLDRIALCCLTPVGMVPA